MEYQQYMPYTWELGSQVHQMDPLSIVQDAKDSGNFVPLYQLLGMDEADAVEISTAWRLSQVRAERDRLLSATDWWALSDRTPTPEQLAYRQALRDITENFDPRVEVVFPTKP